MRILCALPFVVGCLDPQYGKPIDSALDTTASAAVEHPISADIQTIWTNTCSGSGCHTAGGASGGLSLDDGYTATVGVESTIAGVDYIVPSEPDQSYLLAKLKGTQDDLAGDGKGGGKMPYGGTISDADLETITNWIVDGAPE